MSDALDLVSRWAAAEQAMDNGALDGLLAEQFVGVGPLGFVLGRQQWLERFGNGLQNRAFTVADPQVHEYGTAAVVIGVLDQQTSWQGQDSSGRFRISLTAVRPAGQWLLGSVHIGPLQAPPPSQE
jgi:ketosteroid isomerase-like protein